MISHIPSHESIAEAAICKKKYDLGFFFSQKHAPQWRIFSLRNTRFPPPPRTWVLLPGFHPLVLRRDAIW